MEYDSLFVRIHGALISAEKLFATPFSLLDKECTDEINEVFRVMSNALEKLDDKVDDNRRAHLFVVLNTDFSTIPLIEEDENYCHLLNLLPKFSPYLYFRVVDHFEWFPYLGEAIVHCPEVLTFDILRCVGTYLDTLNIHHLISFLHSLYMSTFEKILRMQDSESLKKKNMFVKVFQSLLAFSVSDTLEKTDWELIVKQQFMGKVVRMFLKLLETCVYQYTKGWVGNQMDIYNISVDFDYERWNCVSHKINWSGHCLSHLISKCKKLTMDISVEMYMSWCELDLDENQEKTLQMAVRENAYSCKEALAELNPEEFPDLPMLVSTLQNFALKPKTEDDEISSADLDAIISNLQNPIKTREKWFRAFVNSPSLFSSDNHISIINNHTDLIRGDSALTLINKCVEHIKIDSSEAEIIDSIKKLACDSVKQLPLIEQMSLLSKFYELHGNTQVLLRDSFHDNLTEVLNKIVDNEEKKEELYPELVCSCLQSGDTVVRRMLQSSLNSREKCDITVSLLKEVSPLSVLCVGPTDDTKVTTLETVQMLKSVENLLPQEKDNCIYLVTQLCKNSLIEGPKFLINYLMPLLQNSLQNKEWDKILFWLDLLLPFVNGSSGNGIVEKPLVLLAFLLEVLNQCRLKNPFHRSYTPLSGEACELCIGLISVLISSLTAPCTECEVVWLRNTSSSLSPLAWFHARKLWEQSDAAPIPDNEDILRWSKPNLGCQTISSLSPEERAKLVTSLCKVLPVLTVSEWKAIGKDGTEELELFHVLVDGILVLAQVPQLLKNLSCLSQVLSNFLTFTKVRTIPALESVSHDDAFAVFDKMTIVTRELPGEIVKVRSAQLMNVMQDMLEVVVRTAKSENTSDILGCIMSIKDETLQTSLFKALQNSSS